MVGVLYGGGLCFCGWYDDNDYYYKGDGGVELVVEFDDCFGGWNWFVIVYI